tara:strand:- start:172 stop:402 length:231 start_codon:yes stop_codon:yes gene_type:complete
MRTHRKKLFMIKKLLLTIFLVSSIFFLSACDWNRTEKAQRQIFAPGPDAPATKIGTLQRNQDYFSKTDSDLLEKMR